MSDRLHYTNVRPIAGRINKAMGLSANGSPIRGRRDWIVGAITLENGGYGVWSVAKITTQVGGVIDLYRGKLRDCKAFLEGMEAALKEVAK